MSRASHSKPPPTIREITELVHCALALPPTANRQALIRAPLTCLSPTAACDAYLTGQISEDHYVARSIRQVVLAHSISSWETCHDPLVEALLVRVQTGDYRTRVRAAADLALIYPAMHSGWQDLTLKCLLDSAYRPLRNQAYKLLTKHWNRMP